MRYYQLDVKSIVLKARTTILGILGTFGILGICKTGLCAQ